MLNGTSLGSIQGGVRWDKLRSRETFKRQGRDREAHFPSMSTLTAQGISGMAHEQI